ncbi:KH domain-containing protein [Candidatus Babeliales bacterium]|nr:KH domain-containing protein [Candidatus Babeliales bacterium]
MLKDLVEYIVKRLVDSPEAVKVSEISGEQATIIELRVASEDLGKVIGKEGRTARSLRTLVHAAATKDRKRAVLEILE